MINRTLLLASTAAVLSLLTGAAMAQQEKGTERGMSGPTAGEGHAVQTDQGKGSAQKSQSQEKRKGSAQTEPSEKGKGAEQGQASEKGKGSAQTQPSEKGRGTAQTPSEKEKGSAQAQPSEKGKGSGQTQPSEKAKGTAQGQPSEKGKGSAQTQPVEKGTSTAGRNGTVGRVQLSEKQRTDVHGTILKERNVNRATNVTFAVNIGSRVPRSVHLAALPVSVISLVPQYRSYRYFVVNDEICIVDPRTYEIVEVVSGPGRAAGVDKRGGSARLVLTEAEKRIILQNVDLSSGSTLGLGSLAEGAEVPRNVQLRTFPETVVEQVPKVKGYKFFTAEDRVAIADPHGTKVELVIGPRQ